ncbi:C6 transcription factor [Thelonectria olida]|uniref:C6 transcription factor n=1 Tax=Thelonectria olida TaxID=1576542 RepID=A0A9P9AN81_9HYPO|nr:C6 transcription factor [Thelonectria olida]
MALGAGGRSSRACVRCRRRKTKCNLDGIGEPLKPPCVSCHDTGSDCVLAERRAGRSLDAPARAADATPTAGGASPALETNEHPRSRCSSGMDNNDYQEEATDENMGMELRNPSDALHILARSGEGQPDRPVGERLSGYDGPTPAADAATYPSTTGPSSLANSTPARAHFFHAPNNNRPTTTVLNDYELVQRGLLHPSELPELLHIFAQKYHPYCPIAPAYFFKPAAMERIQRRDYFLLTVLLSIASMDSRNHVLTHRYCWDHTQRLLLEVLLAHPWAQTPRTVEGLLLLAEWLPHIQITQTTSMAPKNLFSEDRTAWSLVGLAVRQGYLLRLDRAAFRDAADDKSKEREDHRRLIWAFVYIADRQISVRLGQSFWSRGPSLSSKFTSKDFPSLEPILGVENEDYVSVLQATLELTQILYNAHLILYSSTQKTLAMISEGDYARYLDDFVRAASAWHTVWNDIQVPHAIKSTLLLMYEYTCLYVNAFSFQAVQNIKRPLADLFSRGIMSSPDGRFSAGAFQSSTQREEVAGLALRFVAAMKEATSTESHICHRYSRMLRNLWCRGPARQAAWHNASTPSATACQVASAGGRSVSDNGAHSEDLAKQSALGPQRNDQDNPAEYWEGLGNLDLVFPHEEQGAGSEAPALPSIEGYLLSSFLPGISDFGHFHGNLGGQHD